MNERIKELAEQVDRIKDMYNVGPVQRAAIEDFAQLIVEECRTVMNDLYHKTPLELCGPLLTADEEIAKHFYGVKE